MGISWKFLDSANRPESDSCADGRKQAKAILDWTSVNILGLSADAGGNSMSGIGNQRRELYEFGAFLADADQELLLRAGEPVPLTPKAFHILLVLIRRSGELVSKEEIMKSVWPDTFVEETNLTRNIFSLRKALGESPENQFILTVSGKGYRFAQRAQLVEEQAPVQDIGIVAAHRSTVEVQIEGQPPRWVWFTATALGLAALVWGTAYYFSRRPQILTERDSVVLSDFVNSTGDAVFDGTLRQGIAVQLEQSPFLSLISDERIQQVLRMMGRPSDVRLTPEIAREVCLRTGSAIVLEGSIASLGSRYVVGLRAENCRSGDVLDEEQAQADRKEDVLNVLSQVASSFRKRVGESPVSIQKHNISLAAATTPSIEALRAYSLGWARMFSDIGPADAVSLFNRAVEIDPQFASAYGMLGRAYGDLGESNLSAENTARAYQLRDRTTDPERFFIEVNYDLQVTGDLEKARQTGEAWAQTYPRDQGSRALLSWIYQGLGKYDKSAEAGKEGISLDRDNAPAYANAAWAYIFLNRLKDAEDTVRAATARKLEFPDTYLLRYDLAFLQNDPAAMQRAVALAEGRSGVEHWLAAREACVLACSGHLQEARTMSRRAAQLAEQVGQRERAATYIAGGAVREALFGNFAMARRTAASALQLSKSRDVEYGAAFVLAMSGDRSRTLPMIEDLERRFPEDTFVKFTYAPTLRAILARDQGELSKSIELLEAATPYELAITGSWSGFFGGLYPVYVRGETYLSMHKGREAAVEFQKILDHRGIVASDPVGALAHLGLARACTLQGDSSKARAAYQNFLALWKDSDPDIPILKQAQAEYDRMR
jgi:DNA-binding winged helix-turn-helix (wHTH) protein